MTKQQLIDNATNKKFQIEFSKDQFDNELIGINKNKWCFHWFRVYSDNVVMFHHSYSMNTGRVKKGVLHGLRVEMSLEKN